MALEQPNRALGKVSIAFAVKLKSFTFLPVLKKLPTEKRVKSESEEGSSKLGEGVGDHGTTEGKTKGTYKAEVVHITDMKQQEITQHSETQLQKSTNKSAVAPSPTTPAVADAEIRFPSPKPSPGTLVTSRLWYHNTGGEINSGLYLNTESQREEEVLSPVSSVELYTSPFSSKESIPFDCWEQDPSWSTIQMLSPSGSVSPCSSVRSGAFSPSVKKIKCHTLSPGSSLMQMKLNSCQTLGCNKHSTSPCPMSTRARHRPPPTHLSLLTAILRKGRLPVLSSALQRPYSPCWPISPVNMSSCSACSAASAVAPMVSLRAKSCVSKGTNCTEPSCKARPKPPGVIAETEPVSPKNQNKGSLYSTTVETTIANDANRHAAGSGIIPTPEGTGALSSLSSYTPMVPYSAPLYKQTQKGIYVSTDPSFLLSTSPYRSVPVSPESQMEGNVHKSNSTSPILRNTNPFQTSSSDLKPMQMAHERSPSPDPKLVHHGRLASTVPKYKDVKPGSHLRNNISQELERIYSLSPVIQHSPTPKGTGLTHLSNTPSASPVLPSSRPGTSTSDCYTLSSSPAIPYHHLSPSPSYSLCSSPTSSLRESSPDHTDRVNKKPHKIKSTYKAFAAIPTNTLLQEQQAIDDEINKNIDPPDPSNSFAWEDPHSQMCSPAQLRQQSAELYQVIDEVLKDSSRAEASSPAKLILKSVASETTRKLTPSPSPRSLGRETKYANFHHQPPAPAEKALTKPGVIRPAVIVSRLDGDKEKSYYQRQQEKHASSMLSMNDEICGRGVLEGERYSSAVPEKCVSTSPLMMNQAGEHCTPSPRSTSPYKVSSPL